MSVVKTPHNYNMREYYRKEVLSEHNYEIAIF